MPMPFSSFSVAPLTPYIGAEIGGIDVTRPLDPATVHEIRAALLEHQVIFFRDQDFDPASLKRFGQYFGRLHIHSGMKGMDEHPEVRALSADENSKHVSGEVWHTDLSCDPITPMGSILNIKVLPPVGGDTAFASMYQAYEELSDRMKTYLEGLTATHDGGLAFKRFNPNKEYNLSSHPVIRPHHETGRKTIYVNRGFTSHINERPEREGKAILAFLFEHCEKPEYQVRFRWQKNSVAFWDNRCTQHLAIWDYFPQKRSGLRVQIEGDPD
jgi:taurine dioxygenase